MNVTELAALRRISPSPPQRAFSHFSLAPEFFKQMFIHVFTRDTETLIEQKSSSFFFFSRSKRDGRNRSRAVTCELVQNGRVFKCLFEPKVLFVFVFPFLNESIFDFLQPYFINKQRRTHNLFFACVHTPRPFFPLRQERGRGARGRLAVNLEVPRSSISDGDSSLLKCQRLLSLPDNYC